MRCGALAVLVLLTGAAHADERVGRTADHVIAAVRDGQDDRLAWLAKQDHPDPWLVAEELCFRGAHAAAAAFAAAAPQEKLAAYVASRRGKPAETQAREALEAGQALRIANYTQRAWDRLHGIKVSDDAVLKIRLYTARAKVLRDLGELHRSDRHFYHAAQLAHALGWRRRATESLSYVAYRYCFGEPGDGAVWSTRKKLEQGEAALVYGAMSKTLLAAVLTKDRAWYVPLGKKAAIETWRAGFCVQHPGTPVEVVDELRACLVQPLELGAEVKRVFVVPVEPYIDLPWVLLLGDREVVYGWRSVGVTAFRPWEGASGEGASGEGVLAIGRPRRKGDTLAAKEARAVGDRVLVGDHATRDRIDAATANREPLWRALHFACPPPFLDELFGSHSLLRGLDRLKLWRQARQLLGERKADLVVLSADESFRLVHPGEGERGITVPAPRTIVSLWSVDPGATRALMQRFYALWNGKVSLPACTALKLAQDFVRSQPRWRHPYYWAGWQLWAASDPVGKSK